MIKIYSEKLWIQQQWRGYDLVRFECTKCRDHILYSPVGFWRLICHCNLEWIVGKPDPDGPYVAHTWFDEVAEQRHWEAIEQFSQQMVRDIMIKEQEKRDGRKPRD